MLQEKINNLEQVIVLIQNCLRDFKEWTIKIDYNTEINKLNQSNIPKQKLADYLLAGAQEILSNFHNQV